MSNTTPTLEKERKKKKRSQQLRFPWLADIQFSHSVEQSPANEEHRFSLDPSSSSSSSSSSSPRMCSVWSLVQSIRTDFCEITYKTLRRAGFEEYMWNPFEGDRARTTRLLESALCLSNSLPNHPPPPLEVATCLSVSASPLSPYGCSMSTIFFFLVVVCRDLGPWKPTSVSRKCIVPSHRRVEPETRALGESIGVTWRSCWIPWTLLVSIVVWRSRCYLNKRDSEYTFVGELRGGWNRAARIQQFSVLVCSTRRNTMAFSIESRSQREAWSFNDDQTSVNRSCMHKFWKSINRLVGRSTRRLYVSCLPCLWSLNVSVVHNVWGIRREKDWKEKKKK